MRRLGALLTVTVALAGAGCGVRAAAPPKRVPAITVPRVAELSPLVVPAARASVPALQQDSVRRRAEKLTVRVRNVNCEGITLGSGFAVDRHLLVTNRHVLAGADELTIDTWDGHALAVRTAEVGALGDLGLAVTKGNLPLVARFGPRARAGDQVTVVGYPLGGALSFSSGIVVDRVDGSAFRIEGQVLRLTARVQHGNSGGPVLDARGRVVGVVFAIELATGFGLAIPEDTLVSLAEAGGFENVPACGSS